MGINPIVQSHHGMIGGTIKFIKRSLDPIGKFNEIIQDRLYVRGASPLIGECTTKMPNCLRARRLIPEGETRTKET